MKVDKGAQLEHYEIVAALGKGGMGEVYLARDTRLDRRVALKILPAEFAVDSDFSFGAVLYEMLSGVSPFAADTVSDVIAAVLTREPLTTAP